MPYITPTKALISDYDYQYISDNQKNRCKYINDLTKIPNYE